MLSRLIVPLALLLPLTAAVAQEAAPMARAERDASNPLRMIIEASKIKTARSRAVEPERVQRVVLKAPATTASAPAPAPVATASTALSSPATTSAAPVALAAADPAPTPPQEAAPTPPPAVPAPVSEEKIPPPEARPEPAPTPAAEPAPLSLARMIEPVTPRPLIGKLRGDVEVVVAFTVNTDGSISGATVKSSSYRQMDASVLDAVQQWRYEPIPAPRAHMVQLVLRHGE